MKTIINNQQLTDYINSDKKVEFMFFWGHQPSADDSITKSCFSQWYAAPFEIDEVSYPTAEHFMMAEKARLFGNPDIVEKILNTRTPAEAKNLGRLVRGFKDEIWVQHRFEIVCRGNIAKFSQNPKLREYLINTGTRVLVEASPVDKIWGIGLAADHPDASYPKLWKGQNLLGYALMEVRRRIQEG